MAAKARQQYYADGEYIDKQAREFQPTMEFKTKIDSIEPGAQVNIIEDIKVNGTSLEVDDKTVDISIPLVIDNLYSTDGVNALSAKQGKVLYDLVQNLASRGRYLSNWNAATGLPTTNPVESHYQYRAGDYYVVSNVAAQGGTNYRPEPGEFIIGQASVTVETEVVKVTDMYLYDGTNWNLLINSTREIAIDSSLSTSSTNPVENRVVTNAINGKQDTLVAGSNIQIANDGKTISATDTTYTAGTNVTIDANNEISAVDTTYTAGANVQISNENVISATDTTYAAGDNIAITNNTISATYTAGTGIDITNGVISNTQTSAEWGNITGTLSDQTDLQNALDDKQDEFHTASTTAPSNPSEGDERYDTTNDVLKVYDGSNWIVTGKTYTAGTNIDISAQNVISADTQFVVVDTLPAVATADENKVYILGPIGEGADKYEEWIVTNEAGHFESASTVYHDFVEIEGDDGVVWNEDRTIQYKYIGINNIHPASTPEGYFIQVDDSAGSNVEKSIYADTPMPFIWTDSISQQIRGEIPVVYGYTPGSFDIYYSDSELTWVAGTPKQFVKIGETSPDLSGKQDKATSGSGAPSTTPSYIGQMYVDTANDNLYVATGTSSSSDWTAVDTNTTYTAGDGIDITNNEISVDVTDIIGTGLSEDANNNIIVDTTVVATKTDLSGKQDKATSGSTAPSTTPSYVGQQYVDTTNDKMYVATGTSSSSDWTEVGAGSGDMLYSDFNWVTKTGATITLDLRSEITPSADFTVNKPSTLEDGQYYILRVISGATAYTMTLGTNVTNPYSEDLTLEASTVQQFTFLAKGGNLELQPSSAGVVYTAGTGITISNDEISADTTVLATKQDIANLGSFEVVDTLPAVGSADEKTIYLLGPIGTGADKYEEWIVTEDSQQQKQWTKIGETSVDLSDLNTKTFYLSSTSDLTTATAALQWHFAGKNAIIVYRGYAYTIGATTNSSPLVFVSTIAISRYSGSPVTENWIKNLQIFFNSSHNATVIQDSNKYNSQTFLETDYNYSTPYTPTYAGSPATKKYVDDNVVQKSATAPSSPVEGTVWYDTTNDILKAYDGTQWNVVGNGDMAYADFNWVTKTGATVTLDFNSVIEPSANFTVNAPSTIKDGQIYILRVESGATAYTMTLGTGITNPYSESTTLTANKIKLFTFLAIDGNLELQPSVQGGGIISSNNTYEDIVYLSQSDYDALVTKDPNTLYSTPEQGEGSGYLVQSEQQSGDKVITAGSDVLQPRLVYLTRTEYENLPSSKLTDGIDYVIIKE